MLRLTSEILVSAFVPRFITAIVRPGHLSSRPPCSVSLSSLGSPFSFFLFIVSLLIHQGPSSCRGAERSALRSSPFNTCPLCSARRASIDTKSPRERRAKASDSPDRFSTQLVFQRLSPARVKYRQDGPQSRWVRIPFSAATPPPPHSSSSSCCCFSRAAIWDYTMWSWASSCHASCAQPSYPPPVARWPGLTPTVSAFTGGVAPTNSAGSRQKRGPLPSPQHTFTMGLGTSLQAYKGLAAL